MTSDLDLFIEMETSQSPPERAIEIDKLFGLRIWPMDLIVYTPQEVALLRAQADPFLSTIENEGKVLYEHN